MVGGVGRADHQGVSCRNNLDAENYTRPARISCGARVLRTDGTAHARAGAKVKRLGATSCFFSVARMNDAILH